MTMKVWVFNEDQLNNALDRWKEERLENPEQGQYVDGDIATVQVFLNSLAARESKLLMKSKDQS